MTDPTIQFGPDGVARGESWTAIVRRNNEGQWWAHVLWCGEGFTRIGFEDQLTATHWVWETIKSCAEGELIDE